MVGQLLCSVLWLWFPHSFFESGKEFIELLCEHSISGVGGCAVAVLKVDKGLDLLPSPPRVVVYEVLFDPLPLSCFTTLNALSQIECILLLSHCWCRSLCVPNSSMSTFPPCVFCCKNIFQYVDQNSPGAEEGILRPNLHQSDRWPASVYE